MWLIHAYAAGLAGLGEVGYQEVIVEAAVLKVMCDGGPVGAVHLIHGHGIALPDATMSQHHVSHLQH